MKINDIPHSRTLHSLSRFDLKAVAKKCGWMSREGGKISAESFCGAMIGAAGSSNASLRIVAFLSGVLSSISVSKQALHKRLNAQACKLLECLLGEAISSKTGACVGKDKLGFGRIIVQDSTSIALAQHLLDVFKGAKNASGERSGLKVHASFDLLGNAFASFEIREQRSSDQGFSLDGVEGLGEGDLLLRDLGYFSIGAFRELAGNGAHVLTRWKPKVALIDPDNLDAHDIFALLRGAERIDRDVLVGVEERLPMRLAAFRVPGKIAESRRRKLKANGKRRGRAPSRELLELQDWQIFLTTCSSEMLSFERVHELYCQRWAIEVLFKGFKSHMRIDRVPPRSSENMVRCLIFSALIRIVISASALSLPPLQKAGPESGISALKLFSLVEALGFEPDASHFEQSSFRENFLRHCSYEKRKRAPLPRRLDSLG